ncbi:unnamed protein product [Dracunculus medinensis]|uniref:Uncharacterized protein n=1 Tax=Dracunculus medinensis TaxID=318479 RepID=A0A0N4UQC3_DRAME|nr:unnamed protein product [Dracunculus medinensis]
MLLRWFFLASITVVIFPQEPIGFRPPPSQFNQPFPLLDPVYWSRPLGPPAPIEEQDIPTRITTKPPATVFPPAPQIHIPDILTFVPQSLSDGLIKVDSFMNLTDNDRRKMLKTCSQVINCRKQDEISKKKKKIVENRETSIAKLVTPENKGLQKSVRRRLYRMRQVKQALLHLAGIGDRM